MSTPEQMHPARELGAEGTRLFEDLRAISLRSAERVRDRELLTENDLYDDNGVPA